jgi:hypothetical protein
MKWKFNIVVRLRFIKYESTKPVIVIFQTSNDPAFVTIDRYPLGNPTRLKK